MEIVIMQIFSFSAFERFVFCFQYIFPICINAQYIWLFSFLWDLKQAMSSDTDAMLILFLFLHVVIFC